MSPSSAPDSAIAGPEPRPWQRLSVRLAALFAAVTLLAVGAVGLLTYGRYQREVADTVGTQLLNIARVTSLLIEPGLHAEVQRTLSPESDAYRQVQKKLAAVKSEVLLTTPIATLSDFDPSARRARLMVVSDGAGRPGDAFPLVARGPRSAALDVRGRRRALHADVHERPGHVDHRVLSGRRRLGQGDRGRRRRLRRRDLPRPPRRAQEDGALRLGHRGGGHAGPRVPVRAAAHAADPRPHGGGDAGGGRRPVAARCPSGRATSSAA